MPAAPTARTRLAPTKVARETFLLHDEIEWAGSWLPVNALVIRSAEPVVVDTGRATNRDQLLADVFSLVEPVDLRWVFVTHEDADHAGNLAALLDAAPNAIAVTSWLLAARAGGTLGVELSRQRWVDEGASVDVGDRKLVAVRPPVYDAPTTRGVFDTATGVYWAADAFATVVPEPVRDVGELDQAVWPEEMVRCHHLVSPWLAIADDRRYQTTVDRVDGLGPSCLVGAHTPLVGRSHVDTAIVTTRRSPEAGAAMTGCTATATAATATATAATAAR